MLAAKGRPLPAVVFCVSFSLSALWDAALQRTLSAALSSSVVAAHPRALGSVRTDVP